MRVSAVLFFLLIILTGVPAARSQEQFQVVTEELPPLSFQENGLASGIFTDLVLRIMDMAGHPIALQSIKVMPWPRAYQMVLNEPGTILYTLGMTEERKNLVKWVGPVLDLRIGLNALLSRRLVLKDLQEAANYSIGVVPRSAPEQLLLEAGIPASAMRPLADPLANIKKLEAGRIDFFAFNVLTTRFLMLRNGMNPDTVKSVLTIKQLPLYIALHRDADDALVARMQQALQQLKQPGKDGASELNCIVGRYVGLGGL